MERKLYEEMRQKGLSNNGQTMVKSQKRNNINSISNNNSNPNNFSSSSNRSSIWRRRINRQSKLW